MDEALLGQWKPGRCSSLPRVRHPNQVASHSVARLSGSGQCTEDSCTTRGKARLMVASFDGRQQIEAATVRQTSMQAVARTVGVCLSVSMCVFASINGSLRYSEAGQVRACMRKLGPLRHLIILSPHSLFPQNGNANIICLNNCQHRKMKCLIAITSV